MRTLLSLITTLCLIFAAIIKVKPIHQYSTALLTKIILIGMIGLTSTQAYADIAYVANTNDGTVSVINTSTNTVTTTIPVGNQPYGIAINPTGTSAYVTNFTDNTVSVINTSTNTVTTTIPVGNAPFGIALTSPPIPIIGSIGLQSSQKPVIMTRELK